MFCYKCGSQLSEEAKFCHKCGAKVINQDMASHKEDVSTEERGTESDVLSKIKLPDTQKVNSKFTAFFDRIGLGKQYNDFMEKSIVNKVCLVGITFLIILGILFLIRMIFSSVVLLLIVVAGGYWAYSRWGAVYITRRIYKRKSLELLLPEGMSAQTIVEMLRGKFRYPYLKGVECTSNGQCAIIGKYAVYYTEFREEGKTYLVCDGAEAKREIMLEAIAVCSYINKFFNPFLEYDDVKDFHALMSAEKHRKAAPIVLVVTVFICLIIGVGYDAPAGLQHGKTSQFDRSYYIENAVSVKDFLRNPSVHSPCYFERYIVDSVSEERVYICRNDAGNSWIVIDDRGKSLSSNALQGDMVTVYGEYSDIVEMVFSDGSIDNQVPVVYAEKLIDNSILPENQEEFFNQVIKSINSSETAYGSGSEYYGDGKAKLVVGADYSYGNLENADWNVEVTDEAYFYRINPVDGYFITFILDYDAEAIDPYQDGAIKEEYFHTINSWYKTAYDIPVYANGIFTNIEMTGSNGFHSAEDLMRGTVRITFHIDSFEAYE